MCWSKICLFWKNWFKVWSFSKILIQNFFLFRKFFSQNNAFQESMEKPTLTFLRWKLTQKTDFSTAIFRTNLDRLEKLLISKQNVFPQRYLSQNQFFRKSLKILSFYSFTTKNNHRKKNWNASFPTNFFFWKETISKPYAFEFFDSLNDGWLKRIFKTWHATKIFKNFPLNLIIWHVLSISVQN